jgi:hypothetical protein
VCLFYCPSFTELICLYYRYHVIFFTKQINVTIMIYNMMTKVSPVNEAVFVYFGFWPRVLSGSSICLANRAKVYRRRDIDFLWERTKMQLKNLLLGSISLGVYLFVLHYQCYILVKGDNTSWLSHQHAETINSNAPLK